MLDTIERTEATTELPLDTVTKRERIEAELRQDASRSDRKIAGIVGCDHKTVGSARERLGIATPLAGSISPPISPPQIISSPPKVTEEPKWDPFAPDSDVLVVQHQPAIAVYENTAGSIVICQCVSAYDEEDPIILIRPENLDALIVRLRKHLP